MNKRRVWRWRLSLGLPLLALALLTALFRWDWLIPIVTARASAALGRPVHIEHLHVALGRTTAITIEGLRIGNPEGFPDNPPFAAVPRASLTFEIMPLLRGRSLVISDITLEQPDVEVLSREDGTTNYAFDFGGPEGEGRASEAGPSLGVLRIRGGRVHVASAQLRADFTIAVATEEPAGQPPRIIAQAEGTYAAQPITARLQGGAILNLRDAEQPWPIDLQLANGPIRVSLRGSMQDPLALRGANLRLDLAGPDMARLMPLTGIPIPATPPFRFTGKLAYAAGAVRFTDVVGQVGSTDVAGTFSVTTGGERPVVTADLTSRRVDLADLGGFIGSTPGRVRTPGQTAVQRQAVAQAEASPVVSLEVV